MMGRILVSQILSPEIIGQYMLSGIIHSRLMSVGSSPEERARYQFVDSCCLVKLQLKVMLSFADTVFQSSERFVIGSCWSIGAGTTGHWGHVPTQIWFVRSTGGGH
jgi:hypothetical protein